MIDNFLPNVLLSIAFAILGFILLFAGWRVFDGLTPGHVQDHIFKEGNMAAAIFAGAFIVGLAMVVAAAIS